MKNWLRPFSETTSQNKHCSKKLYKKNMKIVPLLASPSFREPKQEIHPTHHMGKTKQVSRRKKLSPWLDLANAACPQQALPVRIHHASDGHERGA
jgi:hypothetical protein